MVELPVINIPREDELAARLKLVPVPVSVPASASAFEQPDNPTNPADSANRTVRSWPLEFGPGFAMGRFEVSVAEYRAATKEFLPGHDNRPSEPADGVTWDQAVWCAELMGAPIGEFEAAMKAAGLLDNPRDVFPVPPDPSSWRLSPVESADENIAESHRSVDIPLHLAGNASEWTLTRPILAAHPTSCCHRMNSKNCSHYDLFAEVSATNFSIITSGIPTTASTGTTLRPRMFQRGFAALSRNQMVPSATCPNRRPRNSRSTALTRSQIARSDNLRVVQRS